MAKYCFSNELTIKAVIQYGFCSVLDMFSTSIKTIFKYIQNVWMPYGEQIQHLYTDQENM